MINNKILYIISSKDKYTTAKHFEGIIADGYQTRIVYDFDYIEINIDDIVLYVDPARELPHYSKILSGMDVYAYLIDVHRGLDDRLRIAALFKHVFIAQKNVVDIFKIRGHSASWLPLAYNHKIKLEYKNAHEYDVAFVGNVSHADSDRGFFLAEILKSFNHNPQEQTDPDKMYNIYFNSKIVINKSIGGDLNMRFFEAMGSGALLVSDRINNGEDEIATEFQNIVYYNNLNDAIKIISEYLKRGNEELRKNMGVNARELILNSHTYESRVKQIISVVNELKIANGKQKNNSDIVKSLIYFHYWRENFPCLFEFFRISPIYFCKYFFLYVGRSIYRKFKVLPRARRRSRQ